MNETLLLLLVPLLVVQVALLVIALLDLRRPERRVRGGNKIVWALIIIFISLIGPLVYLAVGREDA